MKNISVILLLNCFWFAVPCKSVDLQWGKPINVSLINTNADDFAPTFNPIDGKLYFNSNISGKSLLYWSNETDNDDYDKPILYKGMLNNPKENRSYFVFTNNGDVYLTAFRPTKKYPVMNIAKSTIQRNAYSEPHFIESLSNDSFNCHPTISPDGNSMVFASSILNGSTLDLFISYKQIDGKWSEPIELGELNSDGNEISPFFYSDSILYFASDGLSGIGGFDIYRAEFFDGLFRRPIPINELNTEYDESDLIVLPDGTAVFASNRPGGKGKFDLYIAKPHSNENIIDEINYELALRTSPPDIRLNANLKYIVFPINNTYPLDSDYFNYYDNLYFRNGAFEFDFEKDNPQEYLFHLIFEFTKNFSSKIKIVSSDKYSEENEMFIERVRRFSDFMDFPLSRLQFISSDDVEQGVFKIVSDTINAMLLSKTHYDYRIPSLQVDAAMMPGLDMPANCIIEIGNTETFRLITNEQNCTLPYTHVFSLSDYIDIIKISDEVSITAKIEQNQSIIAQNTLPLPVFTNINREPYSYYNDNKRYFIYLFKIEDIAKEYESFVSDNLLQLEMIKQNLPIAKSINYYSSANIKTDEAFINQMKRYLNNSKQLEISKYSKPLFDYQFSNIIILMIEI